MYLLFRRRKKQLYHISEIKNRLDNKHPGKELRNHTDKRNLRCTRKKMNYLLLRKKQLHNVSETKNRLDDKQPDEEERKTSHRQKRHAHTQR